MRKSKISRRNFICRTSSAAVGMTFLGFNFFSRLIKPLTPGKAVVSIARIKNGNIQAAVEEAIGLLGGIRALTAGKDRIVLKPNLVADDRSCTTKPEVIKALAEIMLDAGKNVIIGEGSAAAANFNVVNNETFRTRKRELLDNMQKHVFDVLGYTRLAESLNIPLINLHSGEIVEVPLKNGLAAKSLKIHKALSEADLVCSVPMMKTHTLATVTLAMKNFIGLYPGTEYYSVRSWLHDRAAEAGSPGVAYEVIDMNRIINSGLSIIDASVAMEGNGPAAGTLVDMGLIVAGTSPLATDMVGATLMGFKLNEIPSIVVSHKSGLLPLSLNDIELRGYGIEECSRKFARPDIYRWTDINKLWGYKEI
jgi:uncharacterized protein (DUF362 family)